MDEHGFKMTLRQEEDFRFIVEFDQEGVPPLLLDEPEPLGGGAGPNPARLLGAAVASCLSSSLLFCLGKARLTPSHVETEVEGTLVRNEKKRLRIGGISVRIRPTMPPEDQEKMERCLKVFEDFCIVTESVRDGLDVDVKVEPVTPGGDSTGEAAEERADT